MTEPGADILSLTITDAEIACDYGVSLATVRRWGALGYLPPKVGPGRVPRRNRKAVRERLSEKTRVEAHDARTS
jgi:hypothetical protein